MNLTRYVIKLASIVMDWMDKYLKEIAFTGYFNTHLEIHTTETAVIQAKIQKRKSIFNDENTFIWINSNDEGHP